MRTDTSLETQTYALVPNPLLLVLLCSSRSRSSWSAEELSAQGCSFRIAELCLVAAFASTRICLPLLLELV